MNECDFYIYLCRTNLSNKVCKDIISRIKRIENSIIDCDIDDEYDKDKCTYLLSLFDNKEIKKVLLKPIPLESCAINNFKYAIRKYISFKKEKF